MSRIQVLSELVGRAALAARMGIQYGGDRDIYQSLGYPKTITYADHLARYQRQDMAQAIIDRPAKVTWAGDVELVESDDDRETALEKAWKDLNDKLSLKGKLARLDRLTCLGHYGILFLGFNGVTRDQLIIPVVPSPSLKLAYVRPFGEGSVQVDGYEEDVANPRYGLPSVYTVTFHAHGKQKKSEVVRVHHSRIIHTVWNQLDNETEGLPMLEVVYNRLMDLEKLVGGSAEMFWRGARPGYAGKVNPEFQMTAKMEADLKEQIDEFEHNLRRILVTEGVDIEGLASQVSDPKSHVDVQVAMISAVTGIPNRVLTGSERGELASTQDKAHWLEYIQQRREEFAETQLVRPLVDRLIEFKVLPTPKDTYSVKWSDLFAQSEKEQVEVGKARTEALRAYASTPGTEEVMPLAAFFEYFLGLTSDQIEIIEQMRLQAAVDEENIIEEEPEPNEIKPDEDEDNV